MPFFDFIAQGKRVDLSSPESVALDKQVSEILLGLMRDANAPPAEMYAAAKLRFWVNADNRERVPASWLAEWAAAIAEYDAIDAANTRRAPN